MDGKRALIYARIRENQLNPSESDMTRGERQQAVIQAMGDEVVSFGTFLRGPFIAGDLVRPLATDLSANAAPSSSAGGSSDAKSGRLRCRLGGVPLTEGGAPHPGKRGEQVGYRDGDRGLRAAAAAAGSGPFGPLAAWEHSVPQRRSPRRPLSAAFLGALSFLSLFFSSGLSSDRRPTSPSFAPSFLRPPRP